MCVMIRLWVHMLIHDFVEKGQKKRWPPKALNMVHHQEFNLMMFSLEKVGKGGVVK